MAPEHNSRPQILTHDADGTPFDTLTVEVEIPDGAGPDEIFSSMQAAYDHLVITGILPPS